MKKVLLHESSKQDDLPLYSIVTLPTYDNKPKYKKFLNFIENIVVSSTKWPTCDNVDIGALEVEKKKVFINTDKCIGCLLCLSSQRNLDSLSSDIRTILSFIVTNYNQIKSRLENDPFNGKQLDMPNYTGADRKLKSLSDFTSTKETKHIALWATELFNFLSKSENSRMGKEIEIVKSTKPRDGRLDACIISDDNILVCETKVDLDTLLTENRFVVQIPSYKAECQRIIDAHNKKPSPNKKLQIYLLIGGNESDLYPPDSEYCTSNVGEKAQKFYSQLVKYDIKFISADALWLMVLYSLLKKKRLCWDLILDKIFTKNAIGLVTAGIITHEKSKFYVNKISKELLETSEIPFA
jgi:NAD-dependent dihydropyrimidine dehydrogenase PreA subunit